MGTRKASSGRSRANVGGRKCEFLPDWKGPRASRREAVEYIQYDLGPRQFEIWFGVPWTAKVPIPEGGSQERVPNGWRIVIDLGQPETVTFADLLLPPGRRDLEHDASVALRKLTKTLKEVDEVTSAPTRDPGLGRYLLLRDLQPILRRLHAGVAQQLAALASQPDWEADDRQWIVHVWDQDLAPAHRIDAKGKPRPMSARDLGLLSLLHGNEPGIDATVPLDFLTAEERTMKMARKRYREWRQEFMGT